MIEKNKAVVIDYTLTNSAGQVLDSSDKGGPLAYLHGNNNIIPGLENELTGKATGDKISVTVKPEDGYGVRDEALVQKVDKAQLPESDKIQVGIQFQAQMGDQVRILTVTAINDNDVTLDANHPLAGETLAFDVAVKEVRDATEEEIAHGHVHGEHGHHH